MIFCAFAFVAGLLFAALLSSRHRLISICTGGSTSLPVPFESDVYVQSASRMLFLLLKTSITAAEIFTVIFSVMSLPSIPYRAAATTFERIALTVSYSSAAV